MKVIQAANAHEALYRGMSLLREIGVNRDSRNGKVLVSPSPVTTLYRDPKNRVVFWPQRDANPFFHFMEGLWMLAGRNDIAWISQFNSSIVQFSDDGEIFHGSYGFRWINHFVKQEGPDPSEFSVMNQLRIIAEMLRKNPNDRRAVLQMWDPSEDLGRVGKDVPCNTQIYFKISVAGSLDMTVLNRSNDIIWGAYGANVVHMSMLQEFMAAWIGVPVGRYWQVSNDWHAYVEIFEKHRSILDEDLYDPYYDMNSFPMVNSPIEDWLQDLSIFMSQGPVIGARDIFFRRVVFPIFSSWREYKNKENKNNVEDALLALESCIAADWKRACQEWLLRRKGKK